MSYSSVKCPFTPLSLHIRSPPVSFLSFPGRSSRLRRWPCLISSSANGAPYTYVSDKELGQKEAFVEAGVAEEEGISPDFASNDATAVAVDDTESERRIVASYPVPEFFSADGSISLRNPCGTSSECSDRPLLVYAPGMDCTGQGIIRQLPRLIDAGYDIRCIYIPTTDRSSWAQLTQATIAILKEELQRRKECHVTLLGESFGGPLALRIVKAAPELFSRLVLVNPATNLQQNNSFVSFWSGTGLLGILPPLLYKAAQDILLPFLVNRNRVNMSEFGKISSPVDLVPAQCAAWRLLLLNDETDLDDANIRSIGAPTLLMASSEDHMLSSMEETRRLNRLLPHSKRLILPESGHTVLLEDAFDLAKTMEKHGFSATISGHAKSVSKASESMSLFFASQETAVKDELMDEMGWILEPWRFLTSPWVSGSENLPSPESRRPILFVGNHTMFGSYDTPLLIHELYLHGFRCRGLAHPSHWRTFVGPIFERYGHVRATKLAAYKLLKEKQHVLLFPGGAKEVFKKKNEEYKLKWKPNSDFVRMAARFEAIIVPFGSMGGDDAYKILFDADDIMRSPFARLWTELYTFMDVGLDSIHPVTAIPGTNIPSLLAIPAKLERIYFHFAEPIDTASFEGSQHGTKFKEMYSLAKSRVEESIEHLKSIRSHDKERDLPKRILRKTLEFLPQFTRGQG